MIANTVLALIVVYGLLAATFSLHPQQWQEARTIRNRQLWMEQDIQRAKEQDIWSLWDLPFP
jgi:hypothetical protein